MKRIAFIVASLATTASMQGQEKKWSLDYEVGLGHLTGGFGIGFRPKLKKLNMAPEIIERKEPLQMAYYAND